MESKDLLQERVTIHKYSFAAYLLDEAKLVRLMDLIIEGCRDAGMQTRTEYVVELANNKELRVHSLEEVFKLDNAVKNPISRLACETTGVSSESVAIVNLTFESKRYDKISLIVSTSQELTKWAHRLVADIEEQVDRLSLNSWVYRFLKPGDSFTVTLRLLTIFAFIVVLVLLPIGGSANSDSSKSRSTAQKLLDESKMALTTDQKVEFLFRVEQIELQQQAQRFLLVDLEQVNWLRLGLGLLPILLVIVLIVYAVRTCYPRAIFLWGDYKEHYQQLIDKREFIWKVVGVSFLIGVIVNLFTYSLGF